MTSSQLVSRSAMKSSKKRKRVEEATDDSGFVEIKNLLPIKTKRGIVTQQQIINQLDNNDLNAETNEENDSQDEDMDEEMETYENSQFDLSQPISAAQLLTARNTVLQQRKMHIGTLSSGLLENPEEKVTNLRTLLKLIDEDTSEVFLTVRKLVVVSLVEIFKDILPSYEIKPIYNDGVKLKKDTLKLHKYEENLLQYYKRFLQKLEQLCLILSKKKGDSRIRTEEEKKVGEIAVQAMCDLLVAHPYFNYSQNIAHVVVIFLNHSNRNIRGIVKTAITTIFKEDKKKEITLKILRIVNQYLKNHAETQTHTDMLEVLLVLNLRDVNLDFNENKDLKEKKFLAHKWKILQTSKKEKKRKKKLQLLEKEMLETKAEENKQAKQQNLTEITKLLFGIYFRILKNSKNCRVLGVCLEGLAKFAHCINIDYYIDIVNVLDNLLKEDWIGYREQLHCIQTVFAILSGQGESLNLDPTRFYINLYKNLLNTTGASKNHDNFLIVLKILNDALIKRRKQITNKRMIGFIKRLTTLSLHLLHNSTLGSLAIVKNVMQLNSSVDILLDLDSSFGDGKFQAELDDPEYANASSTALYELITLSRHYHPIVAKYAANIAKGTQANSEGNLLGEYGKCTPENLYNDFNMSDMTFNPAVPIPKKLNPKPTVKYQKFANATFQEYCNDIMRKQVKVHGKLL